MSRQAGVGIRKRMAMLKFFEHIISLGAKETVTLKMYMYAKELIICF